MCSFWSPQKVLQAVFGWWDDGHLAGQKRNDRSLEGLGKTYFDLRLQQQSQVVLDGELPKCALIEFR